MIGKGNHALIAGLGLEFCIIMCIGFFGGHYLDKHYDSSPIFTLIGSVIAFALGFYVLVSSANAIVKKLEKEKKQNQNKVDK